MWNKNFSYFLSLFTGILIFAFNIKENSNKSFKTIPQYLPVAKVDTSSQAEKLTWYYGKAIEFKGNTRYRLRFFNLFPKSYKEFVSLYGYSERYGEMPLYAKYEEHIDLFCETSTLNKQRFAAKIVAICINGQWDADAVNFLQECALSFTNEQTLLIAKELNTYGKEEIKSFWFFLFDGPHPAQNMPVDLEKIRSSDPQIYRLAKDAFENVHLQSEKHGE